MITESLLFLRSGSNWFTTVELLGLILNATAMFFVGILALVICGATYCNDKEGINNSFLFVLFHLCTRTVNVIISPCSALFNP